ncbi:MAG: hypothetical protein EAZ77_12850 [Nostocales cyanobacterium]|nr:MAG: hypothetical protein EAZ77_12850 [Nostocales cyanobacterium]
MAVARRSAVSTKSSWFKRNSAPPLGQHQSRSLSTSTETTSTQSSESTEVRPRRKRNSITRKLSTPLVNKAVTSTLAQEYVSQPGVNMKGDSHAHLPMMSTAAAAPIWLLRLHAVYRYSSVGAFLFVAATLVVYGWTVYSQERWSQAYRTLQSLQRNERQLTTTNAALTRKMAEEGEEPAAGLVSPTPGGTIFLPATSHSRRSASSPTIPNSTAQPQTSSPLGY